MTAARFVEEVAGRDLAIADDTKFTTPSAHPLPNGDDATTFAAADSVADFPDPSGLFAIPWGVSDWSLEAWVYYHGSVPGNIAPILGRTGVGLPQTPAEWQFCQSAAATPEVQLRITVADPSVPWANPGIALTASAWHHVVWTLNTSLGAGAVAGRHAKTYKNGTLDATTTLPSTSVGVPTLTTPTLYLGTGPTGAPTFLEVAKLAIYHRELTATEVLDHYDAMTT